MATPRLSSPRSELVKLDLLIQVKNLSFVICTTNRIKIKTRMCKVKNIKKEMHKEKVRKGDTKCVKIVEYLFLKF